MTDKNKSKVILECSNTCLGYENKPVITDLNLKIYEGDYICVVGENGSGKSTLIKSMLGLLKPIKGKFIRDNNLREGSIGYLPQQTKAQKDFPATVYEVVLSGFISISQKRPFYSLKEKKTALDNLEKLNILTLKNKCYRELSGGQQQRVLLARALCAANNVLILDEPVTGLDPKATAELYDNLRYLNKEENITIIMVSHDLKNLLEEADKILHICDDEYFYGTREEYVESNIGNKFVGGMK